MATGSDAFRSQQIQPNYLFYRTDNPGPVRTAALGVEYEWSVWKPALDEIMPDGIRQFRKRFAARWLMHQVGLFSNRDYQVLVIRHRASGELAHYSGATGRYWRWPFMQAGDMQIGDTWTHPAHRGHGLAKFALGQLLSRLARPDRRIWYVVHDENAPSIAIARACGMSLVGKGNRSRPRLFGFLHAYELTDSIPNSVAGTEPFYQAHQPHAPW